MENQAPSYEDLYIDSNIFLILSDSPVILKIRTIQWRKQTNFLTSFLQYPA